MKQSRIVLILEAEETKALWQSAKTDLRHPREQARYLLRLALGVQQPKDDSVVNDNSVGKVLADSDAAV